MNEDKRADWLCETAVFEALKVRVGATLLVVTWQREK